jgi:hypothetical protein
MAQTKDIAVAYLPSSLHSEIDSLLHGLAHLHFPHISAPVAAAQSAAAMHLKKSRQQSLPTPQSNPSTYDLTEHRTKYPCWVGLPIKALLLAAVFLEPNPINCRVQHE